MQTTITGEIDVDSLRRDDSFGNEVDVDSLLVGAAAEPPTAAAAVGAWAKQQEGFEDEPEIDLSSPPVESFEDEPEIDLSSPPVEYPQQITKVGGRLRYFPESQGINTGTTQQSDFVALPRGELEALINTKEALIDTNHRVAALEGLVNSLLRSNTTKGRQEQPYHSPAVEQARSYSAQNLHGELELVEFLEGKEEEEGEGKWNSNEFRPKEEWHDPYGESIYTLLYLCPVRSQGFWYGMFVYLLQVLTISLALADALDIENENNPLQIPAMVGLEVTYAQGGILFMLFAFQSDVIDAILKLGDGFYPLDNYPGSTFRTWLFSCLAQLGAGLLVLLGCFLLTMQASTVIDLMLNLTALLFISEIDDLGFYLAKMGFITSDLEVNTNKMVGIQVPKKKSRNSHRRSLYFLTVASLMVGYGILKNRQLSGRYLPTNLYVQFGDSYNPKIPFYSGILSAIKSRTGKHRKYRDMGTSKILLAYCSADSAWTFSEEENTTPCRGYFAKSYKTKSYDVTSIPDSDWQVLDFNGRLQPFDSFSLVERDCHPSTCRGKCAADGICRCSHDQFGLDCEFSNVCNEIIMDDRFPIFPQVLTPSLEDPEKLEPTPFMSNKFQQLRNDKTNEYLRIYNMPVFYANTTYPANVMFFGGRRWILTTEHVLFDLVEAKKEHPDRWYFPEKTVAVLEDGFHAHHKATYIPFFVSDPVDFETPNFKPTPVGLHWWTVKSTNDTLRHFVPDMAVKTVFLCQLPPLSCLDQPDSFCGKRGYCNKDTGLCQCHDESNYYGDRCELIRPCYLQTFPCNHHGICDAITGACQCHPPWHGDGCMFWHKCYEEDGRCMSGSECNYTSGSCDCPVDPAISGVACELSANCDYLRCANGGLCGPNSQCICRPPYYGQSCNLVNKTQEEFFCLRDEDCTNGTCDLGTGFCDCASPNSYGPLCEHTFNCSLPPFWVEDEDYSGCLNSGLCNKESGVCECPEPYFGPDCSQVPPCLSDEDCGFGTCDAESGFCQCIMGRAAGLRCESDMGCSRSSDCYGTGSSCYHGFCQCESGLGGYRCESIVVGMWPSHFQTLMEFLKASVEICGFEDPVCCMRNDTGIQPLKDLLGC